MLNLVSKQIILLPMKNSPQTATSFAQLENAYDILMSDNTIEKQDIREITEAKNQTSNIIDIHQITIKQANQQDLIKKVGQFSIQESYQEYGIVQTVGPRDEHYAKIKPIDKNSQSNINSKDNRKLTESSELKRNEKKTYEDHTDNSSNNVSDLVKSKYPGQSFSRNQFRKSIEGQVLLNAMDSMFRKKSSNDQQDQHKVYVKKPTLRPRDSKQIQPTKQGQIAGANLFLQRIKEKSALVQRLKNVHIFYKMAIDEEIHRRKNNDRIFMDMFHEDNKLHEQKINELKKAISEQKCQKLNISMKQKIITRTQSNVSIAINQIEKARKNNLKLQESIQKSKQNIQAKEKVLKQFQQEERDIRKEVQNNEKNQLKMKKWKKEFENILSAGVQSVQGIRKSFETEDEYY